MTPPRIRLWTLFKESFIISAFTFGGGFVLVSLMKKKFVDQYHFLKEREMLNLVAIAQASPGGVAVNATILLGRQLAGWKGLLIALFGILIPPFVVISLVARSYAWMTQYPIITVMLLGMQAGVAAILLDVVASLVSGLVRERAWFGLLWMVVSFGVLVWTNLHLIWIIGASALMGLSLEGLRRLRKEAS
jgi:chromate transporter